MRPTRIIVGEVREAEALDMLIALNSGLPGLASIHANSARDAVTKLCTLPLLAGENITNRAYKMRDRHKARCATSPGKCARHRAARYRSGTDWHPTPGQQSRNVPVGV